MISNYLQAKPTLLNNLPTGQTLPNTILFYDGLCGLCDNTIQFLLRADKPKRIKFCALQTNTAKLILKENWRDDTFILCHHQKIYTRSSGALKLLGILGFPYHLGLIFWILPKAIRDAVYNLVAKNRIKWFGQLETCRIPDAEMKQRFIED